MHLPQEAPVMVLPNAILFPHAMLPLYIFEPRYRRMLSDTLAGNRMFCVAMRKPGSRRETAVTVGGLGLIRACVRNPDGTSQLVLEGLSRVAMGEVVSRRPYRVQKIRPLPPSEVHDVQVDALVAKLRELVAARLSLGLHLPVPGESAPGLAPEMASVLKEGAQRLAQYLARVQNPEHLVDFVSSVLLASAGARQTILETPHLRGRLRRLIRYLRADLARHKPTP